MLEDAQRKLARANLPMSDDQLLAIASTAILASDHFPRATDEWEALSHDRKTWTAWKAHYRAAHPAQKRQLLASGSTPHFHGTAHLATTVEDVRTTEATFDKLDTYLDNLAATATTDKTTFQQLLDNNASLTANVAALTANLASLSTAYSLLATTPCPTANLTPMAALQPTRLDPTGYCWTHSYHVQLGHSSATCTR